MLSWYAAADGQRRLDLICVGRWLVTYAPTAAVGAASESSLSPLRSLDSMLTTCMEICSRRLNVVGARVEWRRVPNLNTASCQWQLRSNLASTSHGARQSVCMPR